MAPRFWSSSRSVSSVCLSTPASQSASRARDVVAQTSVRLGHNHPASLRVTRAFSTVARRSVERIRAIPERDPHAAVARLWRLWSHDVPRLRERAHATLPTRRGRRAGQLLRMRPMRVSLERTTQRWCSIASRAGRSNGETRLEEDRTISLLSSRWILAVRASGRRDREGAPSKGCDAWWHRSRQGRGHAGSPLPAVRADGDVNVHANRPLPDRGVVMPQYRMRVPSKDRSRGLDSACHGSDAAANRLVWPRWPRPHRPRIAETSVKLADEQARTLCHRCRRSLDLRLHRAEDLIQWPGQTRVTRWVIKSTTVRASGVTQSTGCVRASQIVGALRAAFHMGGEVPDGALCTEISSFWSRGKNSEGTVLSACSRVAKRRGFWHSSGDCLLALRGKNDEAKAAARPLRKSTSRTGTRRVTMQTSGGLIVRS